MRSKKLSVVLAVIALIISTLACAVGEPTLTNVRMTKDIDGKQPTSIFGTTDTFYVASDLSNGVKGNLITSKWYAVKVADTEPNFLIDTAEQLIKTDTFSGLVYFFFEPPTSGWPVGSYKVEVYFNGVLNSTVEFTVE